MIDDFKNELTANTIQFVCSKWILDRVPFIFDNDRISFIKWKAELGHNLGIDPQAMVFTGSASCGFSLSPHKNYREFNDDSDIDLAIVSELYFNIAWKTLRELGTKRFDLLPKQQNSLREHVDRLVYWGTIATDKLLGIFPFGKKWSEELIVMSQKNPTENRTINIRLYKDFDALTAYQITNLNNLRNKLLEMN